MRPLSAQSMVKPLAKLVPFKSAKETFEKPLKNKAIFIGDVISSIDDECIASQALVLF